ncbi:MAG: YchF family ATPase [Patescibacteria group bacterium]|nr:YchF family ATPase [Patescibacteria group bacterium]MCL5224245.1 YchF family ATPase [Patescibacteria group bacterium]
MKQLSIGIVGLPNVGKSTLFNLLTKQHVVAANYPFATIDPNVGVVAVPDTRINKLSEMSHSAKLIPAVVEFYDIAGLVKGANKGEGLGNQFLSHIRDVRAIVQVVRCFPEGEIIHVEQGIDPLRDIDIINTELILKDLDTVDRKLQKLEGEAKSGDKNKIDDLATVRKVRQALDAGVMLHNFEAAVIQEPVIKELNLLTAKSQIYLLNGRESDVTAGLVDTIKKLKSDYLVCDLGGQPDLNMLIKKAYEVLGLISFFTTGEDETRSWTIDRGEKAPQAAGTIHTDFENKFIRAEVVNWEKLLEAGSWAAARQKGWLRLEGKDYVVQDGDVLEIRHG